MSKAYKTLKEIELDLVVKSGLIQQLKLKNTQLEEKIIKAIEYLKNNIDYPNIDLFIEDYVIDLLNILQGSDKK